MVVRKRKELYPRQALPQAAHTLPCGEKGGVGCHLEVCPPPPQCRGGLYVPPTCREGHEGFALLEPPFFIQKAMGVEGFRVFEVAGVPQGQAQDGVDDATLGGGGCG